MSRLLPLLVLPLLAACFEEEVACTDLAAASSLIHVVDADGAPAVAVVRAEDADGNAIEAVCASADLENCTDWIVGYEVQGEITIFATADVDDCGNTVSGEVTVDVPLDESGCHVVQQEATLALTEETDLGCE